MIPAKLYTLAVPANGMMELPVVGSYFLLLTATGNIQVSGDTFGTLGTISAGQGMKDVDFTRLQFTDKTGAVNNIQVLVAGDEFINQRIIGEVSVIDGGKARTLSQTAFYALGYVGAVAGQFAHGQLWNPVGSGKNLMIEQVYPFSSAGAANGFSLRRYNVALGTLLGGAQNKLFGAAYAGVAEVRCTNNVGVLGTQFGTVLRGAPLKFTEPMVLPPGQGLIVMGGTAGDDGGANFEFFEESI